ncbi:hypothetical protein Aco03nite_016870 [Actinoplanes couchii]|uniref:Uncharacterized protein n=1 Tax=Actinoplanes couchii TaxID=403638 RepID=A0ABQ3X4E9_9ACTN|nr:hypothetical protein Aco03nite_016870 [Actinoplanes couchii]
MQPVPESVGESPVHPLQIPGIRNDDHHPTPTEHGGRGRLGKPGRPILPRKPRPHSPSTPPLPKRPKKSPPTQIRIPPPDSRRPNPRKIHPTPARPFTRTGSLTLGLGVGVGPEAFLHLGI